MNVGHTRCIHYMHRTCVSFFSRHFALAPIAFGCISYSVFVAVFFSFSVNTITLNDFEIIFIPIYFDVFVAYYTLYNACVYTWRASRYEDFCVCVVVLLSFSSCVCVCVDGNSLNTHTHTFVDVCSSAHCLSFFSSILSRTLWFVDNACAFSAGISLFFCMHIICSLLWYCVSYVLLLFFTDNGSVVKYSAIGALSHTY